MALSSFVERTRLKMLVDGATTTADDPTPIYVMDELLQALAAGDTRAGVDAISARLAHRSPVVKQKALKLVAHLGRKGSPDLRRLMARHSSAVRDLLSFRCEPDPFKGDTVWKRVQDYAQEALNALHGEPEPPPQAMASSLRGRIEGFGSGAGGGGGGGGSSGMMGFGSESAGGGGYSGGGGSGGRMMGFGSADVVQSGMQALSSGMRSLSGRGDGYSSALLSDGGGASYGGYGGGAAQGPIVQAGAVAPAPAANGGAAAASSAAVDGAAEAKLVEKICAPAGLRAAPSREDLRAFIDGLAPLDGAAVAQLLQRKLDAGPWQSSLRALCAIEAAVDAGGVGAASQVAAHFRQHTESVRRAADGPQASVRQRAAKLLAQLGGAPAGGAASSQQQPQQLFTEDLLGEAGSGGGGGATVGDALAGLLGEPAGAPSASGAAAPGDLLAGLDMMGAPAQAAQQAAAPAPPASDDLFGGMVLGAEPAGRPAAAPVAPPLAASPLDLLGGLSVGGSPSPAMPAMPTAAPGAASGGLGDLLGSLSLGGPPPGGLGGGGFPGQQPMPTFQHQQPPPPMYQQQHAAPMYQQQQQQPMFGGMAAPGGMGSPKWAAAPPMHGRQPSLGSGSLVGGGGLANGGGSGALLGSGIIASSKDTSFDFVGDALAAAKQHK